MISTTEGFLYQSKSVCAARMFVFLGVFQYSAATRLIWIKEVRYLSKADNHIVFSSLDVDCLFISGTVFSSHLILVWSIRSSVRTKVKVKKIIRNLLCDVISGHYVNWVENIMEFSLSSYCFISKKISSLS